jgi:hypothetical protein
VKLRVDLPAVLELVSLLVETLAKVIPGLKGYRDKTRYASLGASLLIFYNEANEVVAEGQVLISSLRTYVQRMEYHLATGGGDPYALTAGQWMYSHLNKQSIALQRLHSAFEGLWYQLSPLVDTPSFQRLVILLEHKRNAVGTLAEFVANGQMPFDIGYSLNRLVAYKAEENDPEIPADFINPQFEALLATAKYERELNAVPTNVPWEADILRVVKEYLRSRQPEAQLEEIAQGLELIRQAILANFELKDVLLEVVEMRP